jgi:hypothetical protein
MHSPNKRFTPLALAVLVLGLASLACGMSLTTQPAPPPIIVTATPLPVQPTVPPPPTLPPPPPTIPAQPTLTPEPVAPTLYLDQDYYCRIGPDQALGDVTGFPKGTELPLLGSNNEGWYLVKIDLDWSRQDSCWIGGGEVRGDRSAVPFVTPHVQVPVHEYSDWKIIGYLNCQELSYYPWTERGAGSGKFESDVPLMGSKHATIEYKEWIVQCPDFYP